jgi:hypothetical protein
MHVAHHQILSMVGKLADQAGCLVLWPGARGMTHGEPIGMVDIHEALEAVKKDYHVDEDKIYLSGFCEGGKGALLLAQRYPSFVAGVAVWGPTQILDRGERRSLWIDANREEKLLENLLNIPIYVMQGEDDISPNPDETEAFLRRYTNKGIGVDYELIPGAGHIYFATHPMPKIFSFVRGKGRKRRAEEVRFATGQVKYNESDWIRITELHELSQVGTVKATVLPTSVISVDSTNVDSYEILTEKLPFRTATTVSIISNGTLKEWTYKGVVSVSLRPDIEEDKKPRKNHSIEGPVGHAFCDRLVLVQGTAGSEEERTAVAKLVDRLRHEWLERFQGNCLFKKDDEVTAEDVATSNLLVVGAATIGTIAFAIQERCPLLIAHDGLRIADRSYPKEAAGAQIVYPNPLNSNRYVVLVRARNSADYDFLNTDLQVNGWYDYLVWREGGELLDVGYFNSEWSRLIATS